MKQHDAKYRNYTMPNAKIIDEVRTEGMLGLSVIGLALCACARARVCVCVCVCSRVRVCVPVCVRARECVCTHAVRL